MTRADPWILVVGYGSIGRRHFQNLRALGRRDVRLLRTTRGRGGALPSPEGVRVYRELDAALADAPAVVLVCTPTSLHVPAAHAALRAGACVLMEKPVSDTLESARHLAAEADRLGGAVSMAYCFRYHPLYRGLHEAAAGGRLGRVFHVHAWQGSYLPDWHPWEDYRTSYAARADLGGGVVRTLDHELDQVRWTLGQPSEVVAAGGAISGLGVDVEDTADMIFRTSPRPGRASPWRSRMAGGAQANVHVSFGRPGPARGMWVVGEKGSACLDWSAASLTITERRGAEDTVERVVRLPDDFDLNRIYVDMLADALAGFEAAPPRPAIPLADGVAALEMALGALEASAAGRAVALKGA